MVDYLYMLAMTEKLNLHIVDSDFLDIIILFAIVINTQIMDCFYLCNNHFCRIDSHRIFNCNFLGNHAHWAFSHKHNSGRDNAIISCIVFDEKERNGHITYKVMEEPFFG